MPNAGGGREEEMIIISPTAKGIRKIDAFGSGQYGALRGDRLHQGTDYECEPGQLVFSPIDGTIVREARPYPDGDYSGVLIQGKQVAVKLFYFLPDKKLIGKNVKAMDIIGRAQDISLRYGQGMTPHIHLEIVSIDPELFILVKDPLAGTSGRYPINHLT